MKRNPFVLVATIALITALACSFGASTGLDCHRDRHRRLGLIGVRKNCRSYAV